MRLCVATLLLSAGVLAACGDDELVMEDAGSPSDSSTPGSDAGQGTQDGGIVDTGTPPMPSCDPLAATGDPELPAAANGRIEILDFDVFDDTFDMKRIRVRNAGVNFRTFNLWASPSTDARMWTSLALDSCIVFDRELPTMSAGDARNIGTELTITDGLGTNIRLVRTTNMAGQVDYDWASQADLTAFFDPAVLSLDKRWTYATPGDSTSGISPASANVAGFSDFEVSPAFTETSTPTTIDPDDATFTWDGTDGPAEFSIVFDRVLTQTSGRYLMCRVADDGAFTIPRTALDDFAPSSTFGISVSRSSWAPFCNEGVMRGLISHSLTYLGSGRL